MEAKVVYDYNRHLQKFDSFITHNEVLIYAYSYMLSKIQPKDIEENMKKVIKNMKNKVTSERIKMIRKIVKNTKEDPCILQKSANAFKNKIKKHFKYQFSPKEKTSKMQMAQNLEQEEVNLFEERAKSAISADVCSQYQPPTDKMNQVLPQNTYWTYQHLQISSTNSKDQIKKISQEFFDDQFLNYR